MAKDERRGVRPGAPCKHGYPIEVRKYQGGYRARCLKCGMYGPVYENATSARQALLGKYMNPNTQERRCLRGQGFRASCLPLDLKI